MLWEAVLAALIAGFAPWTLLIVATLLSREQPMRHALIFLVTAAVVTLLVGFLVVEALGNTNLENTHRHHSVSPAIDLGLGLAILVFVPYFARRSPKPKPKPKSNDGSGLIARFRRKPADSRAWWERETGLLAVIALGAFVGSPSPLYLASLHSVTKGRPGGAVGALEVLLLAAVVLFMAEVPIILFALAPERTAALLHSANVWLAVHGHTIVVVVLAGAGVYFTLTGLVHLIG